MTRKAAAILAMGSLLLCAIPALATYTIPVSATTEGGGTGTDGQYELVFTAGQPGPVTASTSGAYSLMPGLVAAMIDADPPLLTHEPTPLVAKGIALPIEVVVIDARTGVDSVTLFYREGGRTAFRQRRMDEGTGDTYILTISDNIVTEKGLAYYVEATDKSGNTSRFPAGAPDSLVSVRVWFGDLTSAYDLPGGEYRMVALPGSSNGNPDSVLVDDLGPYDRTVWRLGRWNAPDTGCANVCYDEYPAIDDFGPGRAFWLISKDTKPFDFSGMSVDITRPYVVDLEKGWNQIGSPFAFTTDWHSARIRYGSQTYTIGVEHPVGSDTLYVEDNLIAYDGSYQGLQTELEPWAGYWIYNASTQPVDLLLPPEAPTSMLAASSHDPSRPDLLLAIKASAKGLEDTEALPGAEALAGVSRTASDDWDESDLRHPPPIGDYIRTVFRHDTWGRHSGTYMSDMRSPSQDGQAWAFEVEVSRPASVSLGIEEIVEAPVGWAIAVYDADAGLKLPLDVLPYHFAAQRSRSFVIVAGTDEYVQAHENQLGMGLKPQIVSVKPNPFTRSAEIAFYLPARLRTTLQIFSVEGRLVTTLADSELEPGYHTARWSGQSDKRTSVAPGIYFLRLEVPGTVETSKILRVQ
jgi:hypothetical protein